MTETRTTPGPLTVTTTTCDGCPYLRTSRHRDERDDYTWVENRCADNGTAVTRFIGSLTVTPEWCPYKVESPEDTIRRLTNETASLTTERDKWIEIADRWTEIAKQNGWKV